MLKEIFDHIPQFSLSKKNAVACAVACAESELNYKNVQKKAPQRLNVANCYGGNRIQNITHPLELFEAAEENY